MKRVRNEYVPVVIISVFPVFLYLNIVLSLYHDESRLESNRPTWPTSLGLLVSVLSYCLRSRWGQLPKYKYLSSRAQLIMLNQWLKLTMLWATQPREIRISVIRPAEKLIKKASSQVFELGETVLKKKEDEPRCSTEWHFGSDERGYGYCCFQVNFVLKPYWLPLYLYKKYSRRFMTKISNQFHLVGSTNHYIFFLVIFGSILSNCLIA